MLLSAPSKLASSIPPPSNVVANRLSPTSMELTWEPPSFPGRDISKYQVFYSMFAMADVETWSK